MPRRNGNKRIDRFNADALQDELNNERHTRASTAADTYPHGVTPTCGLPTWECTVVHGSQPDSSGMRPVTFLPTESDLLVRQFDRDIMKNGPRHQNLFAVELGLA